MELAVSQTDVIEKLAPNGVDDTKTKDTGRDHWSKEVDFVLSCIGSCVGLGNLWRFPYLCYKNGGGAFLIPYLLVLFTCGIPLLILESGLGQYMSQGCIGVWNICPAFRGVGFAAVMMINFQNLYYIVVLTWALYYLYCSFSKNLPWATCDNEWNTDRCSTGFGTVQNSTLANESTSTEPTVDAAVEFWERKVLHISDGIDSPGSVVPGLAICLLVAWILVYFCVWRGVKWSGKVAYFTALFPYVILTCLLIRGLTLDGAAIGLEFYLKPDWSRLRDPQVWIDGGTQIFFSYCVVTGQILTLGSYNRFHYNYIKKCLIVSAVNAGTSLVGGMAVFSALGFMAKQRNVSVADVAQSGPGLVFITYPKAITQMPLPQLWSVLFFIMIFLVGIDSQFLDVETFLTPVIDMFPRALKGMKRRMVLAAVYCSFCFLLGISMITQGGMYIFQLFDFYSCSGLVILWTCFFECIAVGWVFGHDRTIAAIELMTGRSVPFRMWFVLCLKFLAPAVSLSIFLFMVVDFKPLTYNRSYQYPTAAQGFGICLAAASMICIPTVLCVHLFNASGSLAERWRQITKPQLADYQIPKLQSL